MANPLDGLLRQSLKIQQDGVARPQRDTIDFQGATVTDDPVAGVTRIAGMKGDSGDDTGGSRVCKAVCLVNIPNLGAWDPNAIPADGISNPSDGETILLVGQTVPEQNGPYLVSSTQTARALTRPPWWRDGAGIEIGTLFRVVRGTQYAGTIWQSMVISTTILVGSVDPKLRPQSYRLGEFTVSGQMDLTPVQMGAITAAEIEYLEGGSGNQGIVTTSRPNANTLRITAPLGSYPRVGVTIKNWSY